MGDRDDNAKIGYVAERCTKDFLFKSATCTTPEFETISEISKKIWVKLSEKLRNKPNFCLASWLSSLYHMTWLSKNVKSKWVLLLPSPLPANLIDTGVEQLFCAKVTWHEIA